MNTLAASFSVSGVHGFLILIAFLMFLVAGVLAWIPQRWYWASLVSFGLALYMLSLLITG